MAIYSAKNPDQKSGPELDNKVYCFTIVKVQSRYWDSTCVDLHRIAEATTEQRIQKQQVNRSCHFCHTESHQQEPVWSRVVRTFVFSPQKGSLQLDKTDSLITIRDTCKFEARGPNPAGRFIFFLASESMQGQLYTHK